jgi:hypothetical protein
METRTQYLEVYGRSRGTFSHRSGKSALSRIGRLLACFSRHSVATGL